MDYSLDTFESYEDERGKLVVFLKKTEMPSEMKRFGQIYFVTFDKKGAIRGNHYHKKWHEWFGVVAGKLEVTLQDVHTKEKKTFVFDSKQSQYSRLKIGPNVAHAFKSLTPYAALLNYANGEWDANDSIKYSLL